MFEIYDLTNFGEIIVPNSETGKKEGHRIKTGLIWHLINWLTGVTENYHGKSYVPG